MIDRPCLKASVAVILKQTFVGKAEVAVSADDDVIEKANRDDSTGLRPSISNTTRRRDATPCSPQPKAVMDPTMP
ncbi:MAG: hypothetical protein WAO20_13500 [Acidobacteriota bacterium]